MVTVIFPDKVLSKKEITRLDYLTELSLFKSRNYRIAIFPRPAILLGGCLLRDSDVARQVRSYLISAEQCVSPIVLQDIASLKQQMAKFEKEISSIKDWLLSIENYLYEWENFFHVKANQKFLSPLDDAHEKILPKQIHVLQQKIREKGNSRKTLKEFKKHFGISKYSMLPVSQWKRALKWLDKYEEENTEIKLSEW